MTKQQPTHCPLCYTLLEVREVAPCWVCGHRREEIEHALSGRHTFAEMRVFADLTAVLCDFCRVDFGSFDPQDFGLPKDTPVGFERMEFSQSINTIEIAKDKYCPTCGYRLAFLKFVADAREKHQMG